MYCSAIDAPCLYTNGSAEIPIMAHFSFQLKSQRLLDRITGQLNTQTYFVMKYSIIILSAIIGGANAGHHHVLAGALHLSLWSMKYITWVLTPSLHLELATRACTVRATNSECGDGVSIVHLNTCP